MKTKKNPTKLTKNKKNKNKNTPTCVTKLQEWQKGKKRKPTENDGRTKKMKNKAKQTNTQTNKHTNKQTNKQTDLQTNRQSNKQSNKQRNKSHDHVNTPTCSPQETDAEQAQGVHPQGGVHRSPRRCARVGHLVEEPRPREQPGSHHRNEAYAGQAQNLVPAKINHCTGKRYS